MTLEQKKKSSGGSLKPAVPKYVLLLIAGSMWFGVGIFLNTYVYSWLKPNWQFMSLVFVLPGMILALTIHHFGFIKVAGKNLKRIQQMPSRPCLFSFMSWKSYVLVVVMISLGIALRLSPIPKNYLSIVYIGIGVALMLSSIKYFKSALILLFRKENTQVH